MAQVTVVVKSLFEAKTLAAAAAVLSPGRLRFVPPVRETRMPAERCITVTQEALAVPGDDRFQRLEASEWEDGLAEEQGEDEFFFDSPVEFTQVSPGLPLSWATPTPNWALACHPPEVSLVGFHQEEHPREYGCARAEPVGIG